MRNHLQVNKINKLNKRRLGGKYEKVAAEYLAGKGHRVVATNFHAGRGELDLVTRDGEWLVFVEVKYRRNSTAGLPEEAVDALKLSRMARAAEFFMFENGIGENSPARFDVVAISGSGDGLDIRHYENVTGF